MTKHSNNLSFETICSSEVEELRHNPSHILPIYASSSFVFEDTQHSIDVFTNQKDGHLYSRYANPTVDSVAKKLARLETFGTDIEGYCLLTNSGMSAISLVFAAFLNHGDTILTQADLYGGTTELINKVFARFGINAIYVDLTDIDVVEKALIEHNITMIYAETPANPSLRCIDLAATARIAKQHHCMTVVDNTFCTPYIQRPLALDIDVVIHSTTKSLNGHGNSIGGAVIADAKYKHQLWQSYKLIGLNPSPFEAWLLHNGMKTLTLRVSKACDNAMVVAKFLETHNKVGQVNYPGLPNHTSHNVASSQMSKFGSMLSFELKGGFDAGKSLMDNVSLITLAPTLGDLDTLMLHPASSSHLNIKREIRESVGITDGLVRMSVGIEESEDLIKDLSAALNTIS